MDIVRAALAHLDHGQRLGIGRQRNILPARQNRRDKGFVILAEGQILAIGRHGEIIDQITAGVDAFVLSVQIGAQQLGLVRRTIDHEDAIIARAELTARAVPVDQPGRPARGGDGVDAGIF